MKTNLLHNGQIIIKHTWKCTQKLEKLEIREAFYGENLSEENGSSVRSGKSTMKSK